MPENLTPAHRSIEAEIQAKGPITFARFMEIALYGEHGYYTSHVTAGSDYATSPQMHPAFGALIAGYLYRAWEALNEPDPFHVIELGAGDGNLSKDIQETISTHKSHPSSFERPTSFRRKPESRGEGEAAANASIQLQTNP